LAERSRADRRSFRGKNRMNFGRHRKDIPRSSGRRRWALAYIEKGRDGNTPGKEKKRLGGSYAKDLQLPISEQLKKTKGGCRKREFRYCKNYRKRKMKIRLRRGERGRGKSEEVAIGTARGRNEKGPGRVSCQGRKTRKAARKEEKRDEKAKRQSIVKKEGRGWAR